MGTKSKIQRTVNIQDSWEGKNNILDFFYFRSMKKCGDVVNERASGRDGSLKCRQMIGEICTVG